MKYTLLQDALSFYAQFMREAESKKQTREAMRELALRDLFFLLYHVLNRKDLGVQWLFERCCEVQDKPNGYLDLWAREHYKSTIVTYALTIQDVLYDPELTIGLFSITRPNAKDFLSQIKSEFENNVVLKDLFPDVLWANPQKDAPVWSLDDGLVLKRKSNPKEATIEAHGLVESMPTGKHFGIRLYDDVIDERHVTNPEMIKKSIKGWELSLNLGSQTVSKRYGVGDIDRYVGTRYHLNDPYAEILKRTAAIERKYPGTVDGKVDGVPVLWSREVMAEKRRKMGPYVFGCQILQDPKADEAQGFNPNWFMRYRKERFSNMNRYLLCDPASEKKKTNDYTVMAVIGLGSDRNYYLLDGIRDRLNLTERAEAYLRLHRLYRPEKSGYEKYGKDADIEHIKYVQDKENYRFSIVELGGAMPKNDRIRRLIPIAEQNRFYLPMYCPFIDREMKQRDFVNEFLQDEVSSFPVGSHDDMLDCISRIMDQALHATFPAGEVEAQHDSITKRSKQWDPWSVLADQRM